MPSTLESPSSVPAVPPAHGKDAESLLPGKLARSRPLFDPEIVRRALRDCFLKLNPLSLMKNPVMFVVEVGAALVTVFLIRDLLDRCKRPELRDSDFDLAVVHGAVCQFCRSHGRSARESAGGHAAQNQRRRHGEAGKRKQDQKLFRPRSCGRATLSIAETGDLIPGDGDVIDGIATVDESVITGESAPVIRESGGDRSAVTGGTKVLSDQVTIRITSNPGETFLDKMIALVEGAERQKTPNEVALNILIAGLTLIFLLAVATLASLCRLFGRFGGLQARFPRSPFWFRCWFVSFRLPLAACFRQSGSRAWIA